MESEVENEEITRTLKKPEDWSSSPQGPEGRIIGLEKMLPFSSVKRWTGPELSKVPSSPRK